MSTAKNPPDRREFLSGGIRELNLSDQQITDLVAFMEALTSPQFAHLAPPASGK